MAWKFKVLIYIKSDKFKKLKFIKEVEFKKAKNFKSFNFKNENLHLKCLNYFKI